MHNHSQCPHASLKFCSICDKTYCEACSREWAADSISIPSLPSFPIYPGTGTWPWTNPLITYSTETAPVYVSAHQH